MSDKYDIAIAYRIYPGISKVPPVFSDDKLKLSELCLATFKKSLGNLHIKLYVILDNCPDIYTELFKKYFDEKDTEYIKLKAAGNAGSFVKQLSILLNQEDSEFIYFAEDDYFYLPDAFNKMLSVLNHHTDIHFISPYNHPDYGNMPIHNQFATEFINDNAFEWKTVATTTMTFLTKKAYLKECFSVFDTYIKNNYDASIWLSLTKHKVKNPVLIIKFYFMDNLWFRILLKSWRFTIKQILFGKKWKLAVAQQTLATHMDSYCLAPDVDWEKKFAEAKEKINFVS